MELLFRRGQSPAATGTIKFDLWAKFDVTEEESALINKYSVRNAILSEGNTRRDAFRALRYGVLLTIAVTVVTSALRFNAGLVFLAGLISLTVGSYLIYQQIREQILVSDILEGREFVCRSVVTLIEKEELLKRMALSFRHLLEAMRTWGGTQVIEITPERAPTLKLVEPSDAAA